MTRIVNNLTAGARGLESVRIKQGRDLVVVPKTGYSQVEEARKQRKAKRKAEAGEGGETTAAGTNTERANPRRKIPKPEDLTLLLNTIKTLPEGVVPCEENFVRLETFQARCRKVLGVFEEEDEDDEDV